MLSEVFVPWVSTPYVHTLCGIQGSVYEDMLENVPTGHSLHFVFVLLVPDTRYYIEHETLCKLV